MGFKAREKYRLASGEVVPGTTTIVGELGWNKNVLVSWANRLGLQGKEARGYVDDKAAIGSLAHAFVLAELSGNQPDTKDYTANQVELAQNCLASYREWKGKRVITPKVVEKMFVSENHGYGGTPDFFGGIDDVLTLVDYKSGGIWPEHIIQVSAYHNLLTEYGCKISEAKILAIPRSVDESFSEKVLTAEQIKVGFEIFLHLLAIWKMKSVIKKEA